MPALLICPNDSSYCLTCDISFDGVDRHVTKDGVVVNVFGANSRVQAQKVSGPVVKEGHSVPRTVLDILQLGFDIICAADGRRGEQGCNLWDGHGKNDDVKLVTSTALREKKEYSK